MTENEFHCLDMLAKETHRVEVIGPMIEEEAEQVFKKLSGMPNVIAH